MRTMTANLRMFVFSALAAACASAGSGDQDPSSAAEAAGAAGTAVTSGGATVGTGGASGNSAASGTAGTSGIPGTTSMAGAGGTTGAGGTAGGTGGSLPSVAVGCDTSAQPPGTWKNVTPPGMNVSAGWGGCEVILIDPLRPSDIYLNCDFNGTWKSTDCGVTWQKVNTGMNGAELDKGRQWSAAIPMDPARGSGTPPWLYTTLGYGRGGLWKSVNGGRDWTDAWGTRIFAPDGVTNISSDVGSDVALIYTVDESDPNYLVAVLHGYFGSGGNTGMFVTTDGGATWIVHKATAFNFTNHADVFYAIDRTTWMVTHLTDSGGQHADVYRTTDAGQTWKVVLPGKFLSNQVGIGMQIYRHGSTVYVPSAEGMHAIFKSTDKGATWTEIKLDVSQAFAIVATTKDLYITGGANLWDHDFKIEHASLTNDTVWTHDPVPVGINLTGGGIGTGIPGWAVATHDGAHDIIVTSNYMGGAWRYVVP
jgi:hypothetical protein